MSKKINKTIIEKLKIRDEEAFELLFNEYKNIVHYVVLFYVKDRFVADDLEQEIFLRLLDKIHLYDSSKSSFNTWFMTLTRNHVLNYLQSQKTRKEIYNVELIEQAYQESDIKFHYQLVDLQTTMTNNEYMVLILKSIQNFKHKEIADYLSITVDCSKKMYRNAIKIAKDVLKK